MTERSRQLTIAALQRAITDSTRPEKIRRACALRLSRLRASASVKRAPITTRATAPAAPSAPTAQACFEAHQAFMALSLQRTALHRKRRTAGEQQIFKAMLALMPAAAPTNDDPKAWTNFVAQVSGLLEEIKAVKIL